MTLGKVKESLPENDHILVENGFRALLRSLQPYIGKKDIEEVGKAFDFAGEIFQDLKTDHDEPRLLHSVNIARIAVEEMGLGSVSAISSLLHDSVVYGLTSEKKLRDEFGRTVAHIVDGFAKLSALPTDKISIQSESFRKLYLNLVDDIRIILIKIAHRLYDMRNIEKLDHAKQLRFTSEVVHIYNPIAHRLGLYRIKKELEDLVMKFEQPDVYNNIAQQLRDTESKRNVFIRQFASPIQKELHQSGLSVDIKGRPKSIPSIWNKMNRQNVEFEQVYDLFAIRIIIDTDEKQEKSDCWRVYSIVTNIYPPNPKRLRDWISTPKATGYESLHTTVMGPNKKWVEVQIRSRRMDELAEKGQAAHWRYKGFGSKKDTEGWLNQVRDILENPKQIDFDELESAQGKKDEPHVYVFTPNGDLMELPAGATVLDFAFAVHTNVGSSCTGAKIDNRIVNLNQSLSNGNKVEILTSKSQKPKLDWLNYVTTTRAKNKIKRALKEEKFQEADQGNEILRRKFRNWKIAFSDQNIDKLIKRYKLSSSVDLYSMISQEKLDLLEIKKFLKGELPPEEPKGPTLPVAGKEAKTEEKLAGDVLTIDRNLDKVNYKLAKCCNPIPGDAVFGFVTISRGITIHRKNCPNARQLLERYHYRTIDVQWKDTEEVSSFPTTIKVTGIDKVGMMTEISNVISSDLKVNMQSVRIDSREGIFYGTIKLIVRNTKHLDELIHKLVKISGVTKAIRVD